MPEGKVNASLLMPVNLTVTAANGNVSKNVTKFGETITYTLLGPGKSSVTAQIENAKQTVQFPLKGDFDLLQDLIDKAGANSVINLNRSYIYNDWDSITEGVVIRNKNVTINGNGYAIDAKGKSRIFQIIKSDDVTIQNITFKNGYCDSVGAIYWHDSDGGCVSGCSFVNNAADFTAALLVHNGNNVRVSDCSFVNNTAAVNGGAFAGINIANCSVFACSFVNNTAGGIGGAIGWDSSYNNQISKCIFVNNNARDAVIIVLSNNNNNLTVNYNIFLDNGCPSEISFEKSDDTSNIDFNWFGNNATDYTVQPKTVNIVPNNWLYLNATANPNVLTSLDPSVITFDLFVYSNATGQTEGKYNASLLMPVNLTVTAANGNVSKNVTQFGETITYTPTSLGSNSITAQIENATQTVEIPIKGDFDLLQDLINEAGANSVINLTRNYTYNDLDTMRDGVVISNRNVTINGNGYTIDAKGQSRIFWIQNSDNVTIQNITFKNGHTILSGGAIYWSADNGQVSGCSFVNNTAKNGGAIYWYESSGGVVSGCIFVNNTADYTAALLIRKSDNFRVSDCSFVNNTAKVNVGAIGVPYSNGCSVSGCSFVNNTASHAAGAILWDTDSSDGQISNSIFVNNTAGSAGAIYWSANDGSVSGCIFVKQNASDSVIYFYNHWVNNLTINDNIFLDNACPSEISFDVSDDSSNIDFNWFGNNATDYSVQPKTVNVVPNNWLYLNATASPSELSVFDSSDITFDLFVYNYTSQMPEDKYANISLLMPVNLTVTAANGNVSKNVTQFGEKITFTPDKLGTASVTASIENVQDTIEIEVVKDNLTLQATCNPIYYGDNASIVVTGFADATGEARAYVGDGLYCATIMSGVATFNVPGVIENTTATIEYYGDDNYNNSTTEVLIIVGPRDASVNVTNSTMELNVDSNGTIIATTSPEGLNVTFASNNESVATVDADGNVVAISTGTAVITVSVGDDVAYAKNSTTVDVTVNKIPTEIILTNDTLDLKVNDILGDLANLTPSEAGNLTFSSSNEDIVFTADGIILARAKGSATVTVSFNGNDKYAAALNKTINVNVSLRDASVSVENDTLELNVDDRYDLNATTIPGFLSVEYVSSNESVAVVTDYGIVTAVGEGNATITLTVGEDELYAKNSTTVTVTVSKAGSEVTIEPIDNVVYGEDVTVKYSIENRTDNVSVIVENGEGSQVSDDNIIITDDTVTVTGLDAGDYKITIVNNADYKIKESNASAMFSVSKFSPTLSLDVSDITYGETEVITITSDITGTVNVTVNGVTLTLELNGESKEILFAAFANVLKSDNKATLSLDNLKAGDYPVTATYNGDENYESVTETDEFTVNSADSTVLADSFDITIGEDAIITATVPDDATGTVTVEVDGTNYTEQVKDGEAIFTIPGLSAGDKTAKVYYSGDDNYKASENTTSFTVNKINPDVSAQNVSSDGKGHVVVSLPEDATGTVTIEIDGRTYTAPVEDGKAVFDVPGLSEGKHDIKVCYSGDDKYESVQFDASITIEGNETNPENKTVKTVDKVAMATGSTDETTGNPILMLLVALMAIGSTALRKLKK